MEVFILWHSYIQPNGEEESKLIGVYSTRELADRAQKKTCQLRGFRDRPTDFIIDQYRIDEDHWTEGYISIPRP